MVYYICENNNYSHLLNNMEMVMPTELEVWNLFWLASLSNAVYFAGLAFLLWVSFRAANMIGDSDNLIGKVLVTIFCLVIVFNMNLNGASAEWVFNGTAGVFSAIQAQGVEISSGAQTLIDNSEPGREFNLVPDLLTTICL